MKRICIRKTTTLLIVAILFAGSINFACCEEDSHTPIVNSAFTNIATNADDLLPNISFDVQPDAPILTQALDAVLAYPEAIKACKENGLYDFPLLEVEDKPLTWRAALLHDQNECEVWIVSFFPEKIPQMAACVIISEQTEAEVFPGSTWMMQKLWEEALIIPSYFWPVITRHVFHMLFEPEDMWSCAALPENATITEEQAKAIADDAVINKQLVGSSDDLGKYRMAVHFNMTKQYADAVCGIWSVHYYLDDGGSPMLVYSVDIDSRDGMILDVRVNVNGLG